MKAEGAEKSEVRSQKSEAGRQVFLLTSDFFTSDFFFELLDPAAWQEGLEKYALAMHLAVALVDAGGRVLGACLNPQRLWSLLQVRQAPTQQGASPTAAGECPFAVAPLTPCTCVADALDKGRVVRARDRTGLVHFAVPLALGGRKVGALVAGQVFDRYPEQLPLEQVTRRLGLSPALVWQRARLEHPVSPSLLKVYEDLLASLGEAFLQNRYHALVEASRLAELRRTQDLLRRANDELERRVAERTAALEEAQKKALQAERLAALGQVVAGLAHESRNALQRSQACLTLLQLRVQDRPEALDLLERLQKAQDDLHRLFDEVREYAAPIVLDLGGCHLAEVWREAWADLVPLCNAGVACFRGPASVSNKQALEGRESMAHPQLREETAGVDLRCVASPFHLKQVFRNLLDNALSAGGDRVEVVIRASATEIEGAPAVQVALVDNGPGFSAGQRQRAFEPFYTTKVQGTGLGLAICKRIVEAHGGQIRVGERPEENPARGAEVLITLPRRGP